MKYVSILALFILFNVSCDNKPRQKRQDIFKAHKNIDSLMSYVNKLPKSKDTVFAGFRIGMTKKEFRDHVKKLRSEGKKVTYEKDLSARSIVLNANIEIGDRYVYYTPIFLDDYGTEYTGNAKCVLIPRYNNGGEMASLKIISFEDWDGRGPTFVKWIQRKVEEKYKYKSYDNTARKHSIITNVCKELLDNDISKLYYTSETLMITNPKYVGHVEYWSTKTFIGEAIIELKKQQIQKEESEKNTF